MARRTQRPGTRKVPSPAPAPVLASVVVQRPAIRVGLLEPPHSHIVCRSCGRISRLELKEEERQLLVALAAQHPAGWSVDGIAFSLTGSCGRCREGRTR